MHPEDADPFVVEALRTAERWVTDYHAKRVVDDDGDLDFTWAVLQQKRGSRR